MGLQGPSAATGTYTGCRKDITITSLFDKHLGDYAAADSECEVDIWKSTDVLISTFCLMCNSMLKEMMANSAIAQQ